MTESEIDEMIKHQNRVGTNLDLVKLLDTFKNLFVDLLGNFRMLFEKYGRDLDKEYGLSDYFSIDKESSDKFNLLWERFSKISELLTQEQKLLLKGGDRFQIAKSLNNLKEVLIKATNELRQIDKELWEINSIRIVLNKIIYKDKIDEVNLLVGKLKEESKSNEVKTEGKLVELEKKIGEAKGEIINNSLEDKVKELKEEANQMSENAQSWLGGIVCLSLLLVLIAIINILSLDFDQLAPSLKDNNVFWIYVFSRLSVGIILIYFLFFAIKNYRSIKHTEFVYRQKASVLSVYVILLGNSELKDHQAGLASQIGRSVFEIHQTGYIKENQDKDNIENNTTNLPIIGSEELLKKILKG